MAAPQANILGVPASAPTPDRLLEIANYWRSGIPSARWTSMLLGGPPRCSGNVPFRVNRDTRWHAADGGLPCRDGHRPGGSGLRLGRDAGLVPEIPESGLSPLYLYGSKTHFMSAGRRAAQSAFQSRGWSAPIACRFASFSLVRTRPLGRAPTMPHRTSCGLDLAAPKHGRRMVTYRPMLTAPDLIGVGAAFDMMAVRSAELHASSNGLVAMGVSAAAGTTAIVLMVSEIECWVRLYASAGPAEVARATHCRAVFFR